MGTLYECLREARLEQFYPAFRANGITRSEALINLGMPEFCALGITATEDKRRLVELVNIIKSVHRSGLSSSPSPQRQSFINRHRQTSSISNSTPVHIDNTHLTGRGGSQSRILVGSQSHSRGTGFQASGTSTNLRLEPSRDVVVQDRVPNFSVSSYMDMLQYVTESSESEGTEEESDDGQQIPPVVNRIVSSSPTIGRTSRGPNVERIKHSQVKGYNYGVHKVKTPTKSKSSRQGMHRHLGDEKIKVCVRKRPLTKKEIKLKEEDIVTIESTTTLVVNEPKLAVDLKAYTLQHEFTFDEVFDESCTNEDVYIRAARPLINCVFNGGTATCFAYGQTGAGKTHTMLGSGNIPGLYLLAGQDIFSIIQSGKYGRNLHVWVSFFEIYCGQLFDLLNRRNRLHAREDGSHQVCIAGLTETEATSVASLVQTLEYGNSVRSKGATGVNPDSSRSHAILQLDIRDGDDNKMGKISFIDLAGSERASDVTDTDKQTRMEGAEINQSLLALKECIRSIDQESRHTPFRQSKLTHILKDSFVGNSRTCMIANISPSQSACENTINTLRYADRVKELKRDSVRGSSVGQTMNLLMNIPPTAPSIFHPSNILSSSTPQRPSSHSQRDRVAVSPDLDPSETPIRGHNMSKRSNTRESVRSRHSPGPSTKSRPEQTSHFQAVPPGNTSRFSAHATAASQGTSAPPPDASPSESDLTDTDSCNVTHPTYNKVNTRQLSVVKSTDTEFDFPTSDFNNGNDFNDLNRSGVQEKQTEKVAADGQAVPAAAAAAESVLPMVTTSSKRAPVVKAIVYKSTDPDLELSHSGTSGSTPAAKIEIQKPLPPVIMSPQISDQPPSFKKAFMQQLLSSDESVDEEDLLAEGSESTCSLIYAPTKPASTISKVGSDNVINQHLMIPLPAESSELTKFTQRPMRVSDLPSSVINILSRKTSSPQHNEDVSVQRETSNPNTPPTSLNNESQSGKVRSPTMKMSTPQPESHNLVHAPPQQQQPTARQLPRPRGKSPSSEQPAPPFPNQPSPRSPQHQPNLSSNEDYHLSPKLRHHSDSLEFRYPAKVSQSPTGEVSDDSSTESLRASLSDQGHGGCRHNKEIGSNIMRKERSDPMLALDLQRKKQTLPDPQNFSKMLTRSNITKVGHGHKDASWKVIRNELPIENKLAAGDGNIERLSEAAVTTTKETHLEEQNVYFNNKIDPAWNSVHTRTESVANNRPRGKHLPQVPVPKTDNEMAKYNQGPHVPLKLNSAIVTEKLSSGAVFSPIHPQPVTNIGTTRTTQSSPVSPLPQPTPVSATSDYHGSTTQQEVKMQLISAHEDQLATVTSLCKYEMRLLLNAKKVSGKRGFEDYLRRVSDILQQKMAAIASLHEQLSAYSGNGSQGSSVASSVSTTSVSLSQTNVSAASSINPGAVTPDDGSK
ncbi:unnamed protein product [Lymnaea stagnalis]|uniref:Kinesin motor domain-containing protein n=1 Tax=Lymnaea stagnalis TaxID=6523 RepID=A0AAV2H2S6_LYMST